MWVKYSFSFQNFSCTDGKLDETKVLHHTSCTNSRLSPKLALLEYHSGKYLFTCKYRFTQVLMLFFDMINRA